MPPVTQVDIATRLAALEAEVVTLREEIEVLERAQIAAAVTRGIEQIERGEGRPAIEAVRALGRKYGLERS